jgi:ABC-type multidrug transport system fused ATPase/permease subunit
MVRWDHLDGFGGRIVESGTHLELLAKKGKYFAVVGLQ